MLFRTDDGVSLHYLDEGQGAPVLLLHAFPLSAESFRPQIDALSSRYRLLVPDHRGFASNGPQNWDAAFLPGQHADSARSVASISAGTPAIDLRDHIANGLVAKIPKQKVQNAARTA